MGYVLLGLCMVEAKSYCNDRTRMITVLVKSVSIMVLRQAKYCEAIFLIRNARQPFCVCCDRLFID